MTPSDFLTILGLAIAIWSIIPSKERKFILVFFTDWEVWAFAACWLIVLYLMSFDWVQANWLPQLSIFEVEKGMPANTVGFIVALFAIAYPIVKVTFSFFALGKIDDLIALNRSLTKENEIDLLVGYIKKYHLADIQSYLKGLSNIPRGEQREFYSRRKKTKEDKVFEDLTKPKRIKFAAHVYVQIIQDEMFIKAAANRYPELFATVFYGMEKERTANQDAVKLYIEQLFENKNQFFVQELKVVDQSNSSIKDLQETYDLPILSGILVHTKVAAKNYVWYPVGEGAIKSLKYDRDQIEFLSQEYDAALKAELWNQKAWIAAVYFNYMVRETIYRDSGWHMWLFYFRNTTDLIIKNIPEDNDYKKNGEYPSFAHYLLYTQFDIMLDWLELAENLETTNRVIDTLRCLGWCINSICNADDRKISAEFKAERIERLINVYCECAKYPDNVACVTTKEYLKRLFHDPKDLRSENDEDLPEAYLISLSQAWDKFDKVPFEYDGFETIIHDFETEILQPLGIAN